MRRTIKNLAREREKMNQNYRDFFLEQVRESELAKKQKEEFILDKLNSKIKGKKIIVDRALSLSLQQ